MAAERRPRTRPHGRALCALWIALCAACGEDVVLGDGRRGGDAASRQDAAPAPERPFSEPRLIAELAAEEDDDDDPSLTADLTLIYFNSEREGGLGQEDIWFSSRDSPADEWRAPEPALSLNTERRETGIALDPSGLAIYWSSDREGGDGGLDVYRATRADRSSAWSAPERVAELGSAGDDLVSALSDGGLRLLLARRADGDDDYDLFIATRSDPLAPFSAPEPIAELNTGDEESDGFLLAGGTELVFTRDGDLQLARRQREDEPFGPPEPLSELNSDGDDRDAWTNHDLSYVVFSSDRSGSHRLYQAER